MEQKENVLEIRGLRSCFFTEKGVVPAVDGIDLDILEGKIIGLVGESGCGKSMTAKSIMGLLKYPGRIADGHIWFDGQDLAHLSEKELRKVCGKDISMIFQEPMTSLNPVLKVGRQVRETLLVHDRGMDKNEARRQVIGMFARVGIPEPEKRYDSYPHQLSGGLRQRVMIAMAMVCRPRLLIADEPTTALDVTIEAQILRLIRQLRDETGMSVLIITHNMGVVAEICDYVYVMYAGKIMEQAETYELFDHKTHPYTKGLLDSIPRIGKNPDRLYTIPGVVPNLLHLSEGCAFSNRCPNASERCRRVKPELCEIGEGHLARCLSCAPESMEPRPEKQSESYENTPAAAELPDAKNAVSAPGMSGKLRIENTVKGGGTL
ncbi:MAG: ABC transporter ATP-binding protein [Clostridiales bacterium]|nr:ABC transporter ATP-binding protein [Clostridiales bacterium]